MSATAHAQQEAGRWATRRPVQALGRLGDACYGVVHLVVAWLAVQVALGDRATEADQRGAVTLLAAQPFGPALAWVVAVGLLAFGVWQLLMSVGGFTWVIERRDRTLRRLAAAGRGVVVLAIAALTLRLLLGGSGGANGSGDRSQQELTARLLAQPGGRVLVVAIGIGALVAAALSIRRAMSARFLRDIDLDHVASRTARWVRWVGTVGYVAKAAAYAVIGVLLGVAAITLDPNRAGGLDKALRTLAAQPFGFVLLIAVALGFVAFGVYCFADARYRKP